MTRREALQTESMLERLKNTLYQASTGYPPNFDQCREDAESLRRISMTLHRWHELECGDGNEHGSWSIERGREVERVTWRDSNPWSGQCVYVPYRRFLACTSLRASQIVDNGWDESKVDAYLLPQPDGSLSAGLRYGADGPDYLSPMVTDAKAAADLATEFGSDGPPFFVHHHYMHGKGKDYVTRTKCPDREAGALKRLAAIMARYPSLSSYIQGDPRGCALYILRQGDVPAGCDVGAYYSRGLAVHQ